MYDIVCVDKKLKCWIGWIFEVLAFYGRVNRLREDYGASLSGVPFA